MLIFSKLVPWHSLKSPGNVRIYIALDYEENLAPEKIQI